MKIKNGLKIREIAGESVVMVRPEKGSDVTKLVSFNETSVYLWNSLQNRDFTSEDVCRLLTEQYEVDEETARRDAEGWVAKLQEAGALEF